MRHYCIVVSVSCSDGDGGSIIDDLVLTVRSCFGFGRLGGFVVISTWSKCKLSNGGPNDLARMRLSRRVVVNCNSFLVIDIILFLIVVASSTILNSC